MIRLVSRFLGFSVFSRSSTYFDYEGEFKEMEVAKETTRE
jgi:hypothetical protein